VQDLPTSFRWSFPPLRPLPCDVFGRLPGFLDPQPSTLNHRPPSAPLCPDRPPATLCQPCGLASATELRGMCPNSNLLQRRRGRPSRRLVTVSRCARCGRKGMLKSLTQRVMAPSSPNHCVLCPFAPLRWFNCVFQHVFRPPSSVLWLLHLSAFPLVILLGMAPSVILKGFCNPAQGWTAHSAFFIPPSSFRRGPTLGSCFRSAPTLKVVVSNRRHRCYGAKIRRQFTGGTKEAHALKTAPKNQAGHPETRRAG
jgi:hypothetical protein